MEPRFWPNTNLRVTRLELQCSRPAGRADLGFTVEVVITHNVGFPQNPMHFQHVTMRNEICDINVTARYALPKRDTDLRITANWGYRNYQASFQEPLYDHLHLKSELAAGI